MDKRKFWWAIFIMMVLCTITYSNHFQNDFHFDDSHTIQNNVYIRNIHNIPLFLLMAVPAALYRKINRTGQ
ncbi:hypothetical protein HK413_03480 [Mucilaginibacter sp. S1162]|uniref:Uncharacterized protein n=1 Tax=Mucilaginibacter humi TaxID=2732510 RepID=A0ABX1W5Y0_9SPHI|nr:hypothetical protein [Mucilaginibacter humi]NNU33457.1 hypothetical protein [Mucilaginibacter humi]